jgi:hypothetical protein
MIEHTMQTQPTDETCGATCLHAIYSYYGYDFSLDEIINTVERSRSGGTLAAFLGLHALKHGFNTTIYINNVDIFDPSWFTHEGEIHDNVISKLTVQLEHTNNKDIAQSSSAYIEYIKQGGLVKFKTLSTKLLKSYFDKDIPVLTGLSATYLYRCKRERFTPEGISISDDIHGAPCGHFVVLCGYDEVNRRIIVADPSSENPLSSVNYYKVSSTRLINAIMLGVLTYDANLLIIEPR